MSHNCVWVERIPQSASLNSAMPIHTHMSTDDSPIISIDFSQRTVDVQFIETMQERLFRISKANSEHLLAYLFIRMAECLEGQQKKWDSKCHNY